MVKILNFGEVSISPDKAFRLLGITGEDARSELLPEILSALEEIKQISKCRLCYDIFSISSSEGMLDLGFARVSSKDLAKNLKSCNKIALVTATVGLELDRLIAKYSRTSPSRAVILQAAGGGIVEEMLDRFEGILQKEGLKLKPRFSCGYGDLELSLQKDIFKALGCEKNIGVYLTDSLLMTPTKSVSAIIGIKQR